MVGSGRGVLEKEMGEGVRKGGCVVSVLGAIGYYRLRPVSFCVRDL